MKIKLKEPYYSEYYSGYKNYNRKTKRYYIQLVNYDGSVTSTSYARYLMSVKLGYFVPEDMDVDHIDGNQLNDSIDNLQLLPKSDNIRKSMTTGRDFVTLICPICKKEFTKERRETHLGRSRRKPTCCSKRCAGKASHLDNLIFDEIQ